MFSSQFINVLHFLRPCSFSNQPNLTLSLAFFSLTFSLTLDITLTKYIHTLTKNGKLGGIRYFIQSQETDLFHGDQFDNMNMLRNMTCLV